VITLNVRFKSMKITVARYARRMLSAAKDKILEIRLNNPDRPLYLIGWGTGSIVAATVSVTHPVDGVIALAFPLLGLSGPRGSHDLEDPILDMKNPTLFVIGGRACDSNITEMELLREQLNCESSMVVIGSGDHNLRINRNHRQRLLVTQSFVDKSIVDEIKCFINLHSKHYQVSAAAALEKSNIKAKKLGGVIAGNAGILKRDRTSSISSNISITTFVKVSPSIVSGAGMSEDSMDSSLFNDCSSMYDESSMTGAPSSSMTGAPSSSMTGTPAGGQDSSEGKDKDKQPSSTTPTGDPFAGIGTSTSISSSPPHTCHG
jgi:hypothetical protein